MFKSVVYVLMFTFLLQHYNASAQAFNNYWLLGYHASTGLPPTGGTDLIFNSDSLVSATYHYREMSFREENASISDSAGNLLFYTNGAFLSNALDDTMVNGGGLNPSSYTSSWANYGLRIPQGALIIPFPSNSTSYYLFHETVIPTSTAGGYLPPELLYSTIDMSLDSGRGAVTLKNQNLLTSTLIAGQIAACKHANGRDWWLIIHEYGNSNFFSFLISPYGIQGPYQQSIGNNFLRGAGQVSFSSDGNWYVRYNGYDGIDIYAFNRCSGLFTSSLHMAPPDSLYGGAAFSPNSNCLYISSAFYIYQFDLTAANISASKQTVAVWDTFYSPSPPLACTFYLAGLAADGKIYVNSNNGVMHLHKINYPDSLGLACDVQQHAIALPTFNAFTMPNYPNYTLGPVVGSICDSLTTGITDNAYNKNLNLRINPNPAQGMFYVNYQLPTGTNADLFLYNTLGEEVMRKKLYWYFGYLQIDASGLNNGVYFLKIKTAKGSAGGKVVVAR